MIHAFSNEYSLIGLQIAEPTERAYSLEIGPYTDHVSKVYEDTPPHTTLPNEYKG